MDKIKEDFEVIIKELSEGMKVKEIPIILNMIGTTETSHVTPLINGILKAIILRSNNPVNIMIVLDEYPGIPIFHELDFVGEFYIPLAISPISKSAHVFNYSPRDWALNNKLRIILKGQKNTEVEIVIRYI